MSKTFIGYQVEATGALAPTDAGLAVNDNRKILSLYNAGDDTVYFGADDTVTTDTGYPLPSGQQMLIKTAGHLIMGTGLTGDVRYAELGAV